MALRDAIARLPPAERDVFLLREHGGLTYQEIAEAGDMTTDAVRASLHRELLAVWTAMRMTIVFATHDPLDAVTLADRVVLLSPRPARVVAELAVDVARPRLAEDPVLHAMARDLTAGLRAAA